MNNEALYMLLNDDLKKSNTEKEKKIEFYLTNPKHISSSKMISSSSFLSYCQYGNSNNKLYTVLDCDITVPGTYSYYDAKIVRIFTWHNYNTNHYAESILIYIHPSTKQLVALEMGQNFNYGGYFIEKRDDNKIHIICYSLSSVGTSSASVYGIIDYEIKNISGTLSMTSTTIQTAPDKPSYDNLYSRFYNKSYGVLVSRFVMTSTDMYLCNANDNTILKHSRNRTDAASDWVVNSSSYPGTTYASSLKHRIKIVHDEINNETYEYYVSYSTISGNGSPYIINSIELYKTSYIDSNKISSMILRITDDSYFNKLSDTNPAYLSTMIEVSVDYDDIKNSYIFIEPNTVGANINSFENLSNLPKRVIYKIEGDKWYKLNRDKLDVLYTGAQSSAYVMYPSIKKTMEYMPIIINSDESKITTVTKNSGDNYPISEILYYEEKEV